MRSFIFASALVALTFSPAGISPLSAADSPAPTGEKKPIEKTYPLRGVIVALDTTKATARVKHEKIPGFMGAMTMEFHLAPSSLKPLAVGQNITATLYVENDDFWLREIRIATPTK